MKQIVIWGKKIKSGPHNGIKDLNENINHRRNRRKKKKFTFLKISNKHPYQSCAVHNGQEMGATQVSTDRVFLPNPFPHQPAVLWTNVLISM